MKFNANGKKIFFDFNSLKFKLWAYFALFAILLMLVLWFLQIFFLNNYYEEMKINETNKTASIIASLYGEEDFLENISEISISNDLFIHIETKDGTIIFSPISDDEFQPQTRGYFREMAIVKEALYESGKKNVSTILPAKETEMNLLAYACYLEKSQDSEIVLYVFSPLYPVTSTVNILRDQLVYVTIISLVLACILSFYLTSRIAQPIQDITKQAKKLAAGSYGITFHGGHYTEIINLANTLTYTSLQLEKSTTLQKDLIANVSHDLRTPLTMVKSYAEMIRDISGDNPEKRESHLSVIIEEADRLNLLVSDMLTLSRMQSGVLHITPSIFNIKEVAEGVLHTYDIFAEQEGYSLLLDCPDALNVNADSERIKQVISNLLNNAVKYCGQDRTVYISIRKHRDKVLCEVTDHGMGISPEEIEQIWDRYYKASTNHIRTTSGTGLGLSIVKEILTLHNAKFGVISKLGKGSTFWFELNLAN